MWLKIWHARYLRCGLPKEEWQNYDEEFKRKEDERLPVTTNSAILFSVKIT